MRVLIQRVSEAAVKIDGTMKSCIGKGLLVFVGIGQDDAEEDLDWMTKKLLQLRIFDDGNGVANLSVTDIRGSILVVSQFTLHARTAKGNRPSYIHAAKPDIAIPLYEKFVGKLRASSELPVATGTFGADMKVSLINDGPFTIWIDSKQKE